MRKQIKYIIHQISLDKKLVFPSFLRFAKIMTFFVLSTEVEKSQNFKYKLNISKYFKNLASLKAMNLVIVILFLISTSLFFSCETQTDWDFKTEELEFASEEEVKEYHKKVHSQIFHQQS